MKPLGIDLGKLSDRKGDGTEAPFIHPTCPGARVYVTREDLKVMVSGGEHFDSEGTDVPREGYGHARVRCGRNVMAWKGRSGHVVYTGLCASCTGLERDNREMLYERQDHRSRRPESSKVVTLGVKP